MAKEIITLTIMQVNPDVDLDAIATKVREKVKVFTGNENVETKQDIKPVAFGLKALHFIFVRNEGQGDLEKFTKDLESLEGVKSVEVTDLRRAIG